MDRLGHIPEETERFRAAVDEAKEKHRLLERFSKYVMYSCVRVESADSRLEAVRANHTPTQQQTERSNKSGCAKLEEGFLRLIELRNEQLAKN